MRTMARFLTRSTSTIAAAAMAVAVSAGSAQALPIQFTVNEGAVPGANPIVISGPGAPNDITGKYEEALVFTGPSSFTANLVVNFASYVLNGVTITSQLDAVVPSEAAAPNLYSLYALVTVSGNFTQGGFGGNDFDFDPLAATANVYLDPSRNTAKNYATATATSGQGEDILLLTASTINASASDGGVARNNLDVVTGGFFSLVFTNPVVTYPAYWPTLASFTLGGLTATASGDVDTPGQGTVFPTDIKGDVDITFDVAAVPEPTSLLLLGTGLVAAVRSRRRKQ